MADRVRVVRRGFSYPIGESLTLVRQAGGILKIRDDERASLTMREVGVGDYCDDMPEDAKARYLERGDLELVPVSRVRKRGDDVREGL